MSATTMLDTCPDCRTAIPPGRLLLAYERSDSPAVDAECPTCRAVAHPV